MNTIEKKWSSLNLKMRLGILTVIGFLVGSFVQGEYDSGNFPGLATLAALFVFILICRQSWRDFGKK